MGKAQTIIKGFDPQGPLAGLILPPRFRKRQSETRFKQEWRLTLAQYAALMREFVGPRRQRGSIQMAAAGAAAAAGVGGASGSVVLTAHNFESTDFATAVKSGVQFQSDGELWEIDDSTGDVQQDGEWWSLEPDTGIGSSYEVRALSAGKVGTWSTSAAADNTWVTINVHREWNVTRLIDGTKTASATFEVGLDGVESALDSAIIECEANRGV